ncbi:MAG: class I tRNA ligase family protein, partial [Candidatus Hydrogenedentes bacterium]|nr:class I tRNA ligase family protein [Candidatus Hydrogenedentota bacterium]
LKVGKKLVTNLFNASKFAIGRFSDVPADQLTPDKITTELDRAVIAQLRPVIEKATAAFKEFDYAQALSLVEGYFWSVYCDNYLEMAKPRTYDEELTAERLSACATLRLSHRALVRMMAPFIPYITEEVWGWTYSDDADMAKSVHKSPWPNLDEFAAVAPPEHGVSYDAAVAVVEAVRRAKADASVSMAAPVASAAITTAAATISAIEATLGDIQRMLKIETATVAEGSVENGLVSVVTVLAPPETE